MSNIKKYKIIRIDEPDFGCEGLPDGETLKDDVLVEDEQGERSVIKIGDALLYMLELDEGDYCLIDDNGNIGKAT
ncbi:MAG: hypothetical protein II931_05565 [Clostridia bacterium]|nr:hypothetical protein [Clostridia bacterium]